MSEPSRQDRIARAAGLDWGGQFGDPQPHFRRFRLGWRRPFDCYCYILAGYNIDAERYSRWLGKLVPATGWSEDALLNHGRKIHRLLEVMWETFEVADGKTLELVIPPCHLLPD